MLKFLIYIALSFSILSCVFGQRHIIALNNGEIITERFRSAFCMGRKCNHTKLIVVENKQKRIYTGEDIDYYKIGQHLFIVRNIPILFDSYKSYRVLADGEVKVFDANIDDQNHIAVVELEKGYIMPVTEKLYNKYIIPYLNKKESFKIWHEQHNPVYPSSKNDRLGGKNQNKVNRFIIKIITIYNGFR